jgi:DNA-binding PadR family transcriptional regulator
MTVTLGVPAPASRRQAIRGSSRTEQELIRLLVLRELEDAGPLAGLDALERITPLTRPLQVETPSFPLLHALLDAGFVTASAERPRRYAITDGGRHEAERLSLRCWPSVRESIGRYSARVARLFPRGD